MRKAVCERKNLKFIKVDIVIPKGAIRNKIVQFFRIPKETVIIVFRHLLLQPISFIFIFCVFYAFRFYKINDCILYFLFGNTRIDHNRHPRFYSKVIYVPFKFGGWLSRTNKP